jgi:hypothetical protein
VQLVQINQDLTAKVAGKHHLTYFKPTECPTVILLANVLLSVISVSLLMVLKIDNAKHVTQVAWAALIIDNQVTLLNV